MVGNLVATAFSGPEGLTAGTSSQLSNGRSGGRVYGVSQGAPSGACEPFFVRHRLQVRVEALDASKEGVGRKALVLHLWNRGELPQTGLEGKVTITEIRRATSRPNEVTHTQLRLGCTIRV